MPNVIALGDGAFVKWLGQENEGLSWVKLVSL